MTDPRVQVILDTLKAGNTRRAACDYAQVDHSTFYRWLAENATFSDAVVQAEAQAELRMAAIVVQAAQRGDARSAQWWLERRRRKDYGQVAAVELTGAEGGPIQTEEVTLQDHERVALRKAIDAELAKVAE